MNGHSGAHSNHELEKRRLHSKTNRGGQVITAVTAGMLKILFDTQTRKFLGIHCIGDRAGEIVHIGQAVMLLGGTVDYFVNATFNYPTMA
jgi:NAD(P) transhydrogenase